MTVLVTVVPVVIVAVGVMIVVVVKGTLRTRNTRPEFLGFLWRFFRKNLG